MEKHLQVISVLQWVISFLAMGECVLGDDVFAHISVYSCACLFAKYLLSEFRLNLAAPNVASTPRSFQSSHWMVLLN